MSLSDEHKRRFSRQIMLADVGESGQEKLRAASVLVIGAGGLGSALIAYLGAAGVGRIGIIDHDHVELSNLQRQIIHEYGDLGRMKVISAADRLSELSPDTDVDVYPQRLGDHNASIISRYDVVADGCDNFATRFAVNRACIHFKKPLVSAAVKGFEGQIMTATAFGDAPSPCYQCFVPEQPSEANTCREVGVIGPLCGIIGSMQALEVIKVVIGLPTLAGNLLRFDGLTNRQQLVGLSHDPDCKACAQNH